MYRLWLVLCSLGALLSGQATLESKLDERIASVFKGSKAPSVSVAVVENGKLLYAKAFGKADIEKDRDADAGTRYAVGSISKQFTAAALLLLQEEGKVSLDDKVAKYFPELTRANEVRVRQLLSHTSGYEDYAPQDYIIPDWKQPTSSLAVVEKWAKKPLNFDPGTRWQYSNTGYVLAALIFEKASGKSMSQFLHDRIFAPLGMSTASDCEQRVPADATAYTRFALGPPRPVAREAAGWYYGAGQLCMTASDLAKWNIAFLGKKILSARSYEQFTKEIKLADGKGSHYGLGLSIGETNGTPVLSHGGEVSGFLAINQVFPDKSAAVTVFSNSDGMGVTGQLASQISPMLLGQAPSAAASEAEITQVRGILAGLQEGRIDRSLFTANANSYFSDVALGDFRSSLATLGALKNVTRVNESLRGGMIHRSYRAQFEKAPVNLNIYVLPDGKYEQFMVIGSGM